MKAIIKTDEMSGYRYRQEMIEAGFLAGDLSIWPAARKVEISVTGCVKAFKQWAKTRPYHITIKP